MKKVILTALVAVAAVLAALTLADSSPALDPPPPATPNPGTGPTSIPKQTYWERGNCAALVRKGKFRNAVKRTYRVAVTATVDSSAAGNYTARQKVTGAARQRLARKARCASNAKITRHRRERISEARETWKFHRSIDALTPYGELAIPTYIAECESGTTYHYPPGSYPLGGMYGIIPSSWQNAIYNPYYRGFAHASAAPPYAQHDVARRMWLMEGSSPWACA